MRERESVCVYAHLIHTDGGVAQEERERERERDKERERERERERVSVCEHVCTSAMIMAE